MQNRYAADVGDFGKFALLKALAKNDLRLGINWCLNLQEESNNDGLFVDYQHLRDCDPDLHDALAPIARSPSRGVHALEQAGILPPNTIFFSVPLPAGAATCDYRRRLWSDAASRVLAESELVFVDPDNGFSSKSVSAQNSGKYIAAAELSTYIARGQSLIVYQHQTRERGGLAVSIPRAFELFRALGCENAWALVFRRCSVRAYAEFLETLWLRQKHFELIVPDRSSEISQVLNSSAAPEAGRLKIEHAPAPHRSLSEPDDDGIRRGVRLFRYLADRANKGDAVGISYGRFIAYIHGAADFRQIAQRNYLPSDSDAAVRIALRVTQEANGRIKVSRNAESIQAGMDTFVWNSAKPFDRPPRAWASPRHRLPYSRDQWLACFPNGIRRIVSAIELDQLSEAE